jgi:hypothetical protein
MNEPLKMPKAALQDLITLLWGEEFKVLGPVARDGGVAFEEVRRVSDLPVGMRESQEPGRYRLGAGVAGEIFGVVNGARSLKPFFFAPQETLLEVQRERRSFKVSEVTPAASRLAVIGVRACDLAALAVQDRIFLHDRFRDTHYETRRKDAFLVAVNCTRSASTCFCVSMGTGPEATAGFDLSLTEMEESFVVRSASPAGDAIVAKLQLSAALDDEAAAARERIGECAAAMQRRLDTFGSAAPPSRGSRKSPLERHRGPMPLVHQLHDRMPDVLLPHSHRRGRTRRQHEPTRARVGLLLLARTCAHSRHELSFENPQPLSPMAHPQARVMDRSVRHIGLCWMRPLYRVVPGWNRPHRGSRRDPRPAGQAMRR